MVERRIIRTDKSIFYEAKDRTGKLPASFPLSYYKLVEFYNPTTKEDK
jgi:hypothetical protein